MKKLKLKLNKKSDKDPKSEKEKIEKKKRDSETRSRKSSKAKKDDKNEKEKKNGVKTSVENGTPTQDKKQNGDSSKKKPKKPAAQSDSSENELISDLCSAGKKVSASDFELIAVIGRGSFGKVMQVRHNETKKYYAMKTMRKDNIIAKNQVTHTKDEKHILQKIKHPFIVNLNFAFQTKDTLYMILDYVNGGELFFHLRREKRFSEERARFYAAEISSALFHLHKNGIIYRDLKPENLLLDSDGHIVITDFGLSKEIGKKTTHTFCGTPEYLAPEVLMGLGHSFPVDWWSLGTLVYEMIYGLPPFFSEDQDEMYENIINGELIFPHCMSDDACDFLAGLLEKDPEARLLPNEIMEHKWFKGLDWKLLVEKKVPPPWKPNVNGPNDRSMIDPEVLQESTDNSKPGKCVLEELSGEQDLFKGFTYEGKEAFPSEEEKSEKEIL